MPGDLDALVRLLTALFEGPSGMFCTVLAGSLVCALIAWASRRLAAETRLVIDLVASVAVLLLAIGPTLAISIVACLIGLFGAVEYLPAGRVRAGAAIAGLLLQVIAPLWWLPHLPSYDSPTRQFIAFGTNMMLLRCWAYAYDRLRRPDPVPPTLRGYLHYMLFFPTFVNGPLMSLGEFHRRRNNPAFPVAGPALSLARVLRGTALAAAALWLAGSVMGAGYTRAVAGGPAEAWQQAVLLSLMWFLSFFGWTEVAIGCSAASGVAAPENFNAPYLAYGVSDFWRRWNMTFNRWLLQYIYLPLGGAQLRRRDGSRQPEWRNTAAVFVVVAVVHIIGGLKLVAPGWPPLHFLIQWGLWVTMSTVGVLATRAWLRPQRFGVLDYAIVLGTVAFNCIGFSVSVFPVAMPPSALLAYLRHLFLLG
jgi:D-alanyl-lipoteichoic acid acyltransferase DltB (MBOAT superfamily)